MPKYIDADELLKEEIEAYMNAQTKITAVEAYLLNHLIHAKIQQLLCDAPAADVQEIRHGKWEEIRDARGQLEGWIHAECGREVKSKESYCPHCGAKMDASKEA